MGGVGSFRRDLERAARGYAAAALRSVGGLDASFGYPHGVRCGQPAVRPHRWWTLSTGGAKGGLRPRGLRPLSAPPCPSTHPNLGGLRGRGVIQRTLSAGVTGGLPDYVRKLVRRGQHAVPAAGGGLRPPGGRGRTASARTTSASLVSLRGRRAQQNMNQFIHPTQRHRSLVQDGRSCQ